MPPGHARTMKMMYLPLPLAPAAVGRGEGKGEGGTYRVSPSPQSSPPVRGCVVIPFMVRQAHHERNLALEKSIG